MKVINMKRVEKLKFTAICKNIGIPENIHHDLLNQTYWYIKQIMFSFWQLEKKLPRFVNYGKMCLVCFYFDVES